MYEFGTGELDAAARVLRAGTLFRYMDGAAEVATFEREFSAALDAGLTLATSSGTAALICALAALGIGAGDEVLIPAYGYIADVTAVLAVGAVPVVCEVDETLAIDPADLVARITPRTAAVLPIHMCGLPSDLDRIVTAARAHGLAVIEDACQAVGGRYRGRRLGTVGDAGAFSFNQAKLITAGEGGAMVTRDPVVHERAFMTHDASAMYDGHEFSLPVHAGLAFRMGELAGAILRVQLTKLDRIIDGLRRTAEEIRGVLAGCGGREAPSNDPAGATGSNLAYQFADARAATRFADAVNTVGGGLWAFHGIALGHSFFEWELLHERRGAHSPSRDPLANAAVQKAVDLPRSRDILERTVLLGYPLAVPARSLELLQLAVSDGAC